MSEEIQQQLEGLRKLASSGADFTAFYARLLQSISGVTSAEAGLVWNCSQPPFRLIAEHQTQANPELRAAIQQNEHLALLDSAIKRKQPILIPPRSDAPARMPVIALAPVTRNGSTEVIELFLRPNQPETDYKFWLQTLHAYGDLAGQWGGHRPTDSPTSPAARGDRQVGSESPSAAAGSVRSPVALGSVPLGSVASGSVASAPTASPSARLSAADLDQYVDQLHRSLEIKETVSAIANETRRLLQADRVSVVQRIRSRGRVVAISGQPSVNRRSATVLLLERLVNRVLPLGKVFWYPTADDDALPGEIEQPLHEYLTQATSRSIVALPIVAAEPPTGEGPQPEGKVDRRWIGGLIIEQFDVRWDPAEMAQVMDQVTRHAGTALRNAVHHRSLWLYPIWHAVGQSRVVVAARNMRRSLLIFLACCAAVAALVFIRVPYRISCDGMLVPKHRQNIFAQVSGIVEATLVEHGSQVDVGGEVVRMKDNNLLIERQRKSGEIAKLEEQLNSIRSSSLGKLRRPEPNTESTEDNNDLLLTSIRQQIEGLKSELAIIEQEIQRLSVTSPMRGTILTWDVREQLQDKPVERGDLLMEVADVAGPWELELKLPDRRIGHLYRAQTEFGQELPVSFLLAAGPSQTWHGKITSVAQATEVDQENGQWIRVSVDFDHNALDIRQARSGVMAKIYCGERSLGYVWLNDIYEFLQSKVFFRLW